MEQTAHRENGERERTEKQETGKAAQGMEQNSVKIEKKRILGHFFGRQEAPMIRKLRRKFVLTAIGSLLIILVLLLGFINAGNYIQVERRAGTMLAILLDHDGTFPQERPAETASKTEARRDPIGPPGNFEWNHQVEAPFETRYFSVVIADDGTAAETNVEHIAAVTSAQADSYAAEVVSGGQTRGHLGPYLYGTKTMGDGATLAVFVDRSSGLAAAADLMRSTLLIGAAALALMFLLVWLLSGMAVRPVVESLEKQKQFISDAGHELKTPLSIISANVDVLEMDGEKNDWTTSIRHQIRRMTDLVNNMLTLSRMEEDLVRQTSTEVNLSQLVRESAEPYHAAARAGNRSYDVDIREGLWMNGDRRSLTELCGLLLDNAMKYSNEGGSVHLSLTAEHRRILLEVANTCDVIPEGNLDRLFERFYRADASRSRSGGGFGIGLSAAKAICECHHGSIRAVRDGDHIIRFQASLPEGKEPDGRKAAKP